MRTMKLGMGLPAIAGWLLMATEASAAPTLRVQVTQRGDFELIGNTLGQNCAGAVPAPVVGTVGACGSSAADGSIDVHWRADSPNPGEAEANTAVAPADARSSAVLELPQDAAVSHAFVYWAAVLDAPGTDTIATFDRPGVFTADLDGSLNCVTINVDIFKAYQCSADVTALIQEHGSGSYGIGGVDTAVLTNANNESLFAGWWLVVLYQDPGEPLRNLAVFDGFDTVAQNNSLDILLDGFLVPDGGIEGKLGLVTFEGDAALTGDQFFFGGPPALSNGVNPVNNFFNSTRSHLGTPVSVPGDLPQLTGGNNSMSGIDLDTVDITAKLTAGQTQAMLTASTLNDGYLLSGFITSIADFRPDFTTSVKSAVDVNGGAVLVGDEIEYTIAVENTGNDTAIEVVLADPLPVGVTYVPGTLEISAGPNAGAMTDDPGDDQGEYDMNANTLVVRLGMNADDLLGGTLAVGESTEVKFRVTIDADNPGQIDNQATIDAAGMLGAMQTTTPTGDGNFPGVPTSLLVDACATDADCTDPGLPRCDEAAEPNACVECLGDSDCTAGWTCDPEAHTCACTPDGAEVCDDGLDNDCNNEVDDGCVVDSTGQATDASTGGETQTSDDPSTGGDAPTVGSASNSDSNSGGATSTGGDPVPTGGADDDSSGDPGETDTSDSTGSTGELDDGGGCSCDARGEDIGGLLLFGVVGLAARRRRR
jgi:uncharacterized repeat protein (TIGR01451 family)/MYXO-CTERM domain-containing protein